MTVQDQRADRQGELDPTEIHNILRNERRRQAIKHLRRIDGPLSVDSMAEHIASVETGESPPPRDVRKSVYVSLHQTHLPKLDELDIVEYDQRDQQIALRGRAEEVEAYMGVVSDGNVSWPTYYLGVSTLSIATLLGVRFDFAFLSSFEVSFWAWYFLALFGVSALYHVYLDRKRRVFGD